MAPESPPGFGGFYSLDTWNYEDFALNLPFNMVYLSIRETIPPMLQPVTGF